MEAAILIPLGLFASVVLIAYFHYRQRHREIWAFWGRELDLPAPDALTGSPALCCGMVVIAVTCAWMLIYIFYPQYRDPELLGVLFTGYLAGLAFLVYYRMMNSHRQWGRRLYERRVEVLESKYAGARRKF